MPNGQLRMTYRLAGLLAGTGAVLSLSACMEPQTAPDLPERSSTEFSVTEVAGGLNAPWSVLPLPDGGALIAEKAGTITRVSAAGEVATVTGGPAPYYVSDPRSQAGLFDIVASRDFATTGEVFISSAYGTPEANGTALYAAQLDGNSLSDLREVFRATTKDTNAHYGAKIVALPDGTVAMSTGDGFVYREAAQDTQSTLGKIVRVGAVGAVPVDNPFGNVVWSFGHRNVQGLALDPKTGQLWEHEHGPRGGDEVNLIASGGNYGWPLATTGSDYNGLRISPFEEVEGTTGFVHQWTPSIAPSGLAVYRGDLFAEWDGDLLVGALAGRSLRRLDMEDGRVVGEEIMLADLGERIRDVRVAPDGSVWVLTNGNADDSSGELLRIAPKGSAS